MHNDSNKKPNVLKSLLKYSGVIPSAATAIDGSIKFLLLLARIASLERMDGHHASMSSMIYNFSNALIY